MSEISFQNQLSEQPPILNTIDSNPQHPFQKQNRGKINKLIGIIILSIFILASLTYYIISLNRKGGILIETNQINGLGITLNDRPVVPQKNTQGLFIPVFSGQYHLKITRPNYYSFNQDILIKNDKTVIIRLAFELLPSKSTVQSYSATIDFIRSSQDQKTLFFLGDDRQYIYKMEMTSRIPVRISSIPLQDVQDFQWSGDPKIALITEASGVYLLEIPRYDFINQTLIKLGGPEIISPVWDPNNSNRIAFAYAPTSGERSLIFTDRSFSYLDRKANLQQLNNPKVVWSPNSNYLALIDRSNNYAKNNIWIYTTTNGSFHQLTTLGNVEDASFSPDSSHLLYSTYNKNYSNNPDLNIIQVSGGENHLLKVTGQISQTAWKNASSFYLPDFQTNMLTLANLDNTSEDLHFSFNDARLVQGMFYFNHSQILIFYTGQSIYTVNLGS